MTSKNGTRRFAAGLREVQHQITQPAGPQQSWVEGIKAIGSGQNDDVASILKAIQFGHEGVQHAVIDSMSRLASASSDCVDLIPEHDDRQLRAPRLRPPARFGIRAISLFGRAIPHDVQTAGLHVDEMRERPLCDMPASQLQVAFATLVFPFPGGPSIKTDLLRGRLYLPAVDRVKACAKL